MRVESGASCGFTGLWSRRAKAKREREERLRARRDAMVRLVAMCAIVAKASDFALRVFLCMCCISPSLLCVKVSGEFYLTDGDTRNDTVLESF